MKYLFLIISLLYGYIAFSQNTEIDSLKNELSKTNIDSVKIKLNNRIGKTLLSNDFLEARKYYLKSLDLDGENIESHQNLALTYYLEGNKDKFKSIYVYLLQNVLDTLNTNHFKSIGSINHNLGIYYYQAGVMDSSLAHYKKAIAYNEKINNTATLLKSYAAIAGPLRRLGDYETCNDYLFKGIELLKDDKENETLGVLYSNLAISFEEVKDFEKAEQYYLQGLNIVEQFGDKRTYFQTATNVTDFYIQSNQIEKADAFNQKLLDRTDIFIHSLPFVYSQTANINKRKGRYTKAIKYANKAIELEKENENDRGIAINYMILGDVYVATKNNVQAKTYYEKAYHIFQLSKDVFSEADVVEKLLRIALTNKEKDELLFEKYKTLQDSINKSEYLTKISDAETKYQTAQKENDIQQLTIENQKSELNIQKQRHYTYSAIGGLIIVALGSLFLLYRKKQKEKIDKIKHQQEIDSFKRGITKMELSNIIGQLEPHEIKNILSGISTDIQDKEPKTYNNLIKLLQITQSSLDNDKATENIKVQLEQAKNLLTLKQQNLFEPLTFRIDNHVDGKIPLPKLLLLNMVQNAIKHGIKGKKDGGDICISLFEENNTINVQIKDTGKGFVNSSNNDTGIGISAYQKLFTQLNAHNSKKAIFEVKSEKEKGTKVSIQIPKNYNYEI
ncbi:MAG: tetratricopeptide repeat protein [Flavobacteriales bacterium]|nr:tetratricopeptide repeat protein [Flavobacteriales bacterium]